MIRRSAFLLTIVVLILCSPQGLDHVRANSPQGLDYVHANSPEGLDYVHANRPEGLDYVRASSPEGLDYLCSYVQANAQASVPRAIRRDVPLTNSIRRAYEAGTRDATGRPGPELLAAADRLHDQRAARSADADDHRHRDNRRSTTTVRRRSPRSCCGWITTSTAASCRAAGPCPAENTDGMVVTAISVNGEAVDLAAPAQAGRGTIRKRAATTQRVGSGSDARAHHAGDADCREVDGEAGDRLAHEAARRPQRPRPPHDAAAWDDTLFQPTQWFPRIAKYDDLRGWDTSLYLGPVGVLQQLRPVRRQASTSPAAGS